MTTSIQGVLQRLIDYLPSNYNGHRQHINCLEFMEHHEWGLALESLIELADESGHYFSNEYWEHLAQAADLMNLSEFSAYCQTQIARNARDLKTNIPPFGYTTEVLNSNTRKLYIADKIREESAAERREKDQVKPLLQTDGVHCKQYGRSGFFYVVDQGRLAEFEFEMGRGAEILYFNETNHWVLPNVMPITPTEKQQIREQIYQWSVQNSFSVDFSD